MTVDNIDLIWLTDGSYLKVETTMASVDRSYLPDIKSAHQDESIALSGDFQLAKA